MNRVLGSASSPGSKDEEQEGRERGVGSSMVILEGDCFSFLVSGPTADTTTKFVWTATYVLWDLGLFPEDSYERGRLLVPAGHPLLRLNAGLGTTFRGEEGSCEILLATL